jgi:hypothetical protein
MYFSLLFLFLLPQYFSLRSIKLGLDTVAPGMAIVNTIVSYGLTATVMQAAAYNDIIMRTYRFHGLAEILFLKHDSGRSGKIHTAEVKLALNDAKMDGDDISSLFSSFDASRPSYTLPEFKDLLEKCTAISRAKETSLFHVFLKFLRANVLPGLLFTFVRECGATGAGIVLGPYVREFLSPWLTEAPPLLAKIVSGIMAGMFTSLMTQWLHNNALRAGAMAQTGALPTTAEVLRRTWGDLGWKMFYLNADRRVLSTATATTVLGLVDVFA